jgi:hypothetical protein
MKHLLLKKHLRSLDICGNAFTGGRCGKGPNVEDCLYDNPGEEGARSCNGVLILIQINNQYKCLTQREKFKCVKREFDNPDLCAKNCPGKCEKNKCIG